MGWGLGFADAAVLHFYNGNQVKDFHLTKIELGRLSGTVEGTLISLAQTEISVVDFEARISPPMAIGKDVWAVLQMVNGDVLVGKLQSLKGDEVFFNFQGESMALSKSMIQSVKFLSGAGTDPLLPPLEKTLDRDLVKLPATMVPGTVLTVTADEITFQTPMGGKTMTLLDQDGKLRVEGVYFFGPASAGAPANCRIKGIDGITSIHGTILGADETVARLQTPYAKVFLVRLASAAELWLVGGNAVYLSDLTPVKVTEESPWGKADDPWVMIWHYKKDANCRKMPLSVGGKTYKRGLGVHTKCELSFQIPEGYLFFECLAGIDDRVAAKAKEITAFAVSDVRFLVDGKVLFEKRVSGAEAPVSVKVDLRGGKILTLVADYGEKAKLKIDEKGEESPDAPEREVPIDFGDWVNFVEARFSK